ncbi:LysR family transcriptional regulator [Gordonibacter massiliensis (ex Traore et al. 2017)]|uniref:LysR family transcriptional regulator n=1 Tax=Gordonibacter massiliensis (ex Traore et al. 2017) TaxID=1841863 RepID=A0A842JMV7_9ACTN|nr:LysR family transcriptional regulator [Gordonibacter massiliensis (ex Traore et al. 2017)]MBC2890570.1 LysR family transcriptional regulator [Gordonibacter massiliensis (ex Traore et al. 2017)]
MDLVQLRYFLDVAETEHVTKSAQRLHVAQPALSRSLHRLEDELGSPLLEHVGRNIRLTPGGRLLRDRVAPLVRALDGVAAELAALDEEGERTVRISLMSASSIAIDAVTAYRAAHPGTLFKIGQGDRGFEADVLVDTVPATASADAALGGGKAAVSLVEDILAAVPADFPLAGPELSLRDLEGCEFVCLAGSRRFRGICDDLCARHGFKPSVAFESDNPSVVQRMIGLGQGVGFWPEISWGSPDRSSVRLVRLAEPDFQRRIVVGTPSRTRASAESLKFLDYLAAHLRAAGFRTN